MIENYIQRNNWNEVDIEGLLVENGLEDYNMTKNGRTIPAIRGHLTVRVEQNGSINEIPVNYFTTKYKNDGTENPIYTSLKRVKDEYVSLASSDAEHQPDMVHIKGANIEMNEYYPAGSNVLTSYPRIKGTFCERVRRDEVKPHATFSAIMMVHSTTYEVDKEGIETGRYKVIGLIPAYGDTINCIPFIVEEKKYIDIISNNWEKGNTVFCKGFLRFTSSTQTIVKEVDFGDPVEKQMTVSISEIIINGGQTMPLEEEQSYDINYINTCLENRKHANENKKKMVSESSTSSVLNDLGF